MSDQRSPDWDPKSDDVQRDQRAAYDQMRHDCPVAYSDFLGWSLFRHGDVLRVLDDHQTFGNAVSQHLSVPNGMDPPEHTEYRRIIEPYFSQQRMEAFEPKCRVIAVNLVQAALPTGEVELMADFALPFAARVQCAFLGWPPELHATLLRWTQDQYEATLAQDREALSDLARQFDAIIDDVLEERRQVEAGPEHDITAALMHETVWGRPLSNEEISSILRNWTVGEIGTISASVGILCHFLATHSEIQDRLREDRSLIPVAIDEILRIHGPLVSNRRVSTCPVELGGRKIEAGERISLNWMSANRDEQVFEQPDEFRWDREPSNNLLWGAGIHVCPGAPLARLELRVCMEELLGHSIQMQLIDEKQPKRAVFPASGFATLAMRIE
jgi:cytochrome P450